MQNTKHKTKGSNGIRTTEIESKNDEMDADDGTEPIWSEEEQEIFCESSRLHFHLPFNGVEKYDSILIDCEYVESLSIVQGYYYLRIPLLFYDWELKSSLLQEQEQRQEDTMPNETNFEGRVKVHCRINHSNSMKVQVMCLSFFDVCFVLCCLVVFFTLVFCVFCAGLQMSIKLFTKHKKRGEFLIICYRWSSIRHRVSKRIGIGVINA